MPVRRYTYEQLLQLRGSPLVRKPDNLPPIEQWIDEASHPQSQQDREKTAKINTRQPRAAVGGDASPMGNFSTGQRPSLLQTRTTGSRSDDVVLGPPKSTFTSSRSITRLTSYNDSSDQNTPDDLDISRTQPFGDRAHQRKNTSTNDRDLRGERESWTATRDRRAMGDADHARGDSAVDRDMRNIRRDREYDTVRRTNDRSDNRWEKKQNGERQGGWRDSENSRRPWDRQDNAEREPEWFDEPVVNKQLDDEISSMGPARTQEDFQKWKAMMASNGKDSKTEIKESTPATVPQKPRETLKIEGVSDQPLVGFGIKSPEPGDQSLGKAPQGKTKASRFASMFKKDESPVENPAVPEPQQQPVALPISAANSEDQEGFKRILSMLGGTKIGTAEPSPSIEPRSPTKTSANGARQRSRFFDSTPKIPEETQPALPPLDSQHHRNNTSEVITDQGLPHRGTSTPENNIQNLLASQRAQRQTAPTNKDTAFLLGLLQGHSSRPPSQGTRPDSDFPLWVSPPPEPHAPKPRMAPPPPGHIDESLLRNAPSQGQNGVNIQRPPPGFDDQSMFRQPPQQFQPPQQAQFDHNRRVPQVGMMPPGMPPPPGFPSGMRQPMNNFPGPQQNQPMPGYPPGMPQYQGPGVPPGFGPGMVPNGPPPGFNGASAGRGFENMFDPRR